MTNTITNVPRVLLAELQEHIHCHHDAVLWGKVCALLSAPSPAGVDGLKRYEVFPYLDDEVAEIDICESDDGSFVKYEDAQAIIDGLRGEVDVMTQHADNYSRMFEECAEQRDQFAGLLREAHDTYRAAIHWEDLRSTMKRIDTALAELPQ